MRSMRLVMWENALGFLGFGILVPSSRIIVLCLLLLVVCRWAVFGERLETEGNTDLVRLLKTNTLLHLVR